MEAEQSLFDKLGGKLAVELAVDKFYEELLQDSRVSHFFDGIDMEKQRRHQKAFLTVAFGGVNNYNGRNMRKAHERLVSESGLNDEHFDIIVGKLAGVLLELGVAQKLVEQVGAVAESVRSDVLNR